MKKSVYEIVTERIVELLNQGQIPWRKPWKPEAGEHCNLISKMPYRGINVFLLGCAGFDSPWWLTFRQARQLGGQVRKGEKGTVVVFWKWLEEEKKDEETGETKRVRIPLLRYYTVFNIEQCEGIPAEKIPSRIERPSFSPHQAAQGIIDNMPHKPTMQFGGDRAFYRPSLDLVQLPKPESFESMAEYYSTAFHELVHSTGHSSRLDRKEITHIKPFGSQDYSREELVAEMGAAFLCAVAGIEQNTIANSAAYIQGWLKVLKDDKKLVVLAAAAGQKAADFIRGQGGQMESEAA
jgi:antirestriction protein ArdC